MFRTKTELNYTAIYDILQHGQQYNRDWVNAHPDHWLTKTYEILHKQSDIFLFTSCEITAHMIRWKLSELIDNWEMISENISFEDVHDKYDIFQITIGEDWTSSEHMATIFKRTIIQSYYNYYTIEKTYLTSNIIGAINEGSRKDGVLTNENYQIITQSLKYPYGIKLEGEKNMRVFYWVPCKK